MKRKVFLLFIWILLVSVGFVVAEDYTILDEYYDSIDYSCEQDSDCEIKDRHKCCGFDSYCMNKEAVVDADFVRLACENEGMDSTCDINIPLACSCENNLCIETEEVCDSDNLDLCLNKNDCETASGEWKSGVCSVDNEGDEDDNGNGNQGLGQIIRNRVKVGVYTSPTGEQIRVSQLAQNRFRLNIGNSSVDCDCELEEETEGNKTKLKVKLKNGRNAEIKIMPDIASETALNKLRLKVCNSDNNCSIELKEVGKGEKTRLAYEIQAERHARILAMFKVKMQVRAEVDAETGELIRIKKPWWAFLALEPEEE